MGLPNLSYMVTVGQLRAIQAAYESPEHCNPDDLAHNFLPVVERWGCAVRGRFFLQRMRLQPFYSFVLARTRYYDQVFLEAIEQGARFVINIGCGSDTRAHRFHEQLLAGNVGVVECDQPDAIRVKREIATRKMQNGSNIEYLPIDLNDPTWPEFERWMQAHQGAKLLVMLEGVSPYVQSVGFDNFLRFLTTRAAPGSQIAYDFKHEAALPEFGRSHRTDEPFRLPADRDAVARFHAERGLRLDAYETSIELTNRLAPALTGSSRGEFDEDCLIRLTLPHRDA